MQAWDTWLPDVLPHVEGCPTAIARHEIRRAAQAFFKESRSWQKVLALLPVAALQRDVTITTGDAAVDPVRAEACWIDGRKIDPISKDDLDAAYGDVWPQHQGVVDSFYQLSPGVVSLYRIPVDAAATGLLLRVSLMPSETSTGLPDDLATQFRDDIALGAKARLMMYPRKAWSDSALGMTLAGAFSGAINAARMNAARNFGSARIAASRASWC